MAIDRIQQDFRDRIDPGHAWILGRLDSTTTRLDVLSAIPSEPREIPLAPEPFDAGECACPDPCQHDHANE